MRAHTTKYLFLLFFFSSCCLGVFAQNPGKAAYMKAENLRKSKRYQEAIAKYEEAIRLDYLKRLNERYEGWINAYESGNLLIIDVDDNDFINEHFYGDD